MAQLTVLRFTAKSPLLFSPLCFNVSVEMRADIYREPLHEQNIIFFSCTRNCTFIPVEGLHAVGEVL